jgi:hypothetical protein
MISIIEFLSNLDNYYPTHKALLCVAVAGQKNPTRRRKNKFKLLTADCEFPLLYAIAENKNAVTHRSHVNCAEAFFVSRALLLL